ncbi:MAG: ribosome biogenesis GTP-binding protein YihA/YsxC [Nitrospiria bacterium]
MKITSVEYIKGVPRWQDAPGDGFPEVAMIGRSNVGKSSLINFLLGRKMAYVSKKPGKTQLIHFFLINRAFYLVDLPGYGYSKASKLIRTGWGPMVESYFLNRKTLRAVSLLIDIRHPEMPIDLRMKEWLEYHRMKTLFIATKGDKLSRGKGQKQMDIMKHFFGISKLVATSSLKKEGKVDVWKTIGAAISKKQNSRADFE